MTSDAELVWDAGCLLGEGPVWSAEERCVWFVDIKRREINRYGVRDRSRRTWTAPDQTGFVLPAEDGSLVCGVRGGLHRFTPQDGRFELILAVEEDRPQNRLNDGFVAPDGSLWFGSMDDAEQVRTGALYRYAGGRLEVMDDGYGVTNGPALSPDGQTLYHHDTLERRIYAFDHDDGRISNKRLFGQTPEGGADGPSVDAAGVLHVGLYGGCGVARFAPDGARLPTLPLPVSAVTKAAFGGDDLRTLYCTTARKHLDAEGLAKEPLAGGLFALRVETPGLAQAKVKL